MIPEINNGQLIKIIRDKFLIDAIGYNKIKGTPIARTELVTAIGELIGWLKRRKRMHNGLGNNE